MVIWEEHHQWIGLSDNKSLRYRFFSFLLQRITFRCIPSFRFCFASRKNVPFLLSTHSFFAFKYIDGSSVSCWYSRDRREGSAKTQHLQSTLSISSIHPAPIEPLIRRNPTEFITNYSTGRTRAWFFILVKSITTIPFPLRIQFYQSRSFEIDSFLSVDSFHSWSQL